MNERTPSPIENFLAERQIMPVMERLFTGVRFYEVDREEKGGRLISLTFEGVDYKGERMLYEYYAYNQGVVEPVIRVTFCDENGTPCGGHNVANSVDGFWKIDE